MSAKEFYEKERLNGNTEDITGNPNPDYNNRFYSEIFDLMISFAKLHVLEALKQASEKAITSSEIKENVEELSMMDDWIETSIDKTSILNAYSLDNVR